MPLPALFQALPAPSSDYHAVVEGIAFAVVVGAGKAIAHFRGKQARTDALRDAKEHGRKIDRISSQIDEVSGDVRDLRAYVIGPDGQNGLRGDVRELSKRVGGLEDRERDRPHVPAYDRRAKP